MDYKLNEQQLKKLNKKIKKAKELICSWEDEGKRAEEDLEKYPKKYYQAIQSRKKYASTQIEYYKKRLEELIKVKKAKKIIF